MKFKFVIYLLLLSVLSSKAAYFKFVPIVLTQPDKTVINCYASGDEFYHWLHDEDGYTIIQSEGDGYYYYAVKEGENLVPSQVRVGSKIKSALNVTPWLKVSVARYNVLRQEGPSVINKTMGLSKGVLSNIVIYVRFKNEVEFTKTRATFNTMLNNASVSSLKGYYNEVSYGKLSLESNQYPVCDLTTNLSYQDINERGYYSPYNAVTNPIGYNNDNGDREQSLVERVINAVKSQIPSNMVIDANNDGNVDNVTIVVHGNADGWGKLLWPHQWSLYMKTVYINTKRVSNYIFITENMFDVKTMCHEMFHVIGAPDLYHYTDNGMSPAGNWDLMEQGSGHMLAFMKWKYSGNEWINSIPEITRSGDYGIKPLTGTVRNCYKIKSPNSSTEYYVLEFRKKTGLYEGNLPSSGMIITRINTLANGNGNGPPDEVYVVRPNGTTSSNGDVSIANFISVSGRNTFNSTSNPKCFLSDGSDAGINITNIAMATDSVRFHVEISKPPVNPMPADKTTGIGIDTVLAWENGSPTIPVINYKVYFGTATNPTTLVAQTTEAKFDPGTLLSYKIYYWKVNAVTSYGEAEGPIWRFLTSKVTSVEEDISNSDKINISPNPVQESLNITGIQPKETAEIYNLLGTRVFAGQVYQTLNVSYLPKGMYILKIKGYSPISFIKE
jgi:M6 family metalloprotease-like protein